LAHAFRTSLRRERQHLTSLTRLLEGVSYRAALERGFALVRGADAHVRRRAQAVAAGERLTLTFADGEIAATAGGTPEPPGTKPAKLRKSHSDQGSLL
jgi:exodeoxyribonuclease VII large subunit